MKTLQALFEEEKENLLSTLSSQKDIEGVIKQTDTLLGRILFRFNENEESEKVKAYAYAVMQSIRASLPLIDSTGEPEIYTYTKADGTVQKRDLRFLLVLCIGIACCAAACVLVLLSMRAAAAVLNLPVVLILLCLGIVCIFFGGKLSRPKNSSTQKVTAEIKADPERIRRHLLAAIISADHLLDEVRTEERIEQRHQLAKEADDVDQSELRLLAQLLEDAYADKNSDLSKETISHIKYYLHSRRIQALDYTPDNASWFDILPGEGGTLRPALVIDGALLRKGLASGGRR